MYVRQGAGDSSNRPSPETLEATSCVASSAEYHGVRTWELLPYLKIDGMLEYIAESVFLRWLEGLGRKSVYFDVLESSNVCCPKA